MATDVQQAEKEETTSDSAPKYSLTQLPEPVIVLGAGLLGLVVHPLVRG